MRSPPHPFAAKFFFALIQCIIAFDFVMFRMLSLYDVIWLTAKVHPGPKWAVVMDDGYGQHPRFREPPLQTAARWATGLAPPWKLATGESVCATSSCLISNNHLFCTTDMKLSVIRLVDF